MKIKRLLSVVLSISIIFTAFAILSSVVSFAADDVIEISTSDDLIQLANRDTNIFPYYKGKTIKMTADITMPDNWTPFEYFGGIFDGQGHTLTINMNVDGKGSPVFGFCRYMMDGAVINTHFSGSITTTTDNACLIEAMWCNSVIANCINDMTISGKDFAGGYAYNASGNDNIVAENNIFIGSVVSSSGNPCPMFNQTNSANANLKMVSNFSTTASSSNSFGFEVKDAAAMKSADFIKTLNDNRAAAEQDVNTLCGKNISGQLIQMYSDAEGKPSFKEPQPCSITVEDLLGYGTIEVASSAMPGDTVTGKIKPTKNYAYQFDFDDMEPVDFAYYDGSLMVNNVRTGTTTVNPDGTVDFSFVMPASNVSLFAEFINTNYVYDDCDIFDADGTAVDYEGPGGVVIVPGRIKVIDTSTQLFFKNKTITSLIFKDGVEKFSAMSTCAEMAELRHVELPDSLNYLSGAELEGEGAAFAFCSKLIDASVSGGVTTMPYGTFMGTGCLKNVTLHEGIKRLAKGQFVTSSIPEVVLPSTVTEVNEFVFGRMWGTPPAFKKCVVLGKDTVFNVGKEGGMRSTAFYVDGSSNVVDADVYAEKGSKAEAFVNDEARYFNNNYHLNFVEISEIHFETNGGSLITPLWGTVDDASSTEGVAVTAPKAPTKLGYLFDGWYADEALTTEYIFDKLPNESITVYAKWKVDENHNPDSGLSDDSTANDSTANDSNTDNSFGVNDSQSGDISNISSLASTGEKTPLAMFIVVAISCMAALAIGKAKKFN